MILYVIESNVEFRRYNLSSIIYFRCSLQPLLDIRYFSIYVV